MPKPGGLRDMLPGGVPLRESASGIGESVEEWASSAPYCWNSDDEEREVQKPFSAVPGEVSEVRRRCPPLVEMADGRDISKGWRRSTKMRKEWRAGEA